MIDHPLIARSTIAPVRFPKSAPLAIIAALVVVFAGCKTNTALPDQGKADPSSSEKSGTRNWEQELGKRVTVTGMAINRKVGAFVAFEGSGIYVDLPSNAWPIGLYHGDGIGEVVEVTGTVTQRSDLPVFIQQPGEEPKAGIPVPPGTDLNEAAKRYILESVEWKRVTTK